ncbi:MAG: methyltransferase domain-containing protein [Thermoplasmata archaeon]|nr:methyltransferase domain-containing protein [Thermoplasmata archaeon]
MPSELYGDLARFYDRIYAGKDYEGETREILRRARTLLGRKPRTLLDFACGTGRHLGYFRDDLEVAGVDLSGPMLRQAKRRLGSSVPLMQGDMRSFQLDRAFDVLVCLFSAIGYLPSRRDRLRAFANFHRHLAPGGVAAIEGWILPSKFRPRSIYLQTYDGPEAKIARLSRASRRGSVSRIEMEYLVLERGRPIRHLREAHSQPLVEPKEMLAELEWVGFHAQVVLSGRWRDRGLYVAQRPLGSDSASRTGSAPGHSTLR